jgi:hypothetical protein
MRAPVLLALVLLGACARTPWVNPGWGWETARGEHFVLHSDRSGRTIEQTLARFEETHAALSATFFSDVEVPHENTSGLCAGVTMDHGPEECRPDIGAGNVVLSRKAVDLYVRVGVGGHF